jgi:hypothetical protein
MESCEVIQKTQGGSYSNINVLEEVLLHILCPESFERYALTVICFSKGLYLGFYERATHFYRKWDELSGENQSKKMISYR